MKLAELINSTAAFERTSNLDKHFADVGKYNQDICEHLDRLIGQLKRPATCSVAAERISNVFDAMTPAEFIAWYRDGGLYRD